MADPRWPPFDPHVITSKHEVIFSRCGFQRLWTYIYSPSVIVIALIVAELWRGDWGGEAPEDEKSLARIDLEGGIIFSLILATYGVKRLKN